MIACEISLARATTNSNARSVGSRLTPSGSSGNFWQLVRDRRFRGLKFRRQHRIGPYVLDFYCPDLRVGIELDGAQHFELGAHEADDDRARVLKRYGVTVFHFENREILEYDEGILEWLASELPVTPDPSPRA